MTRAQDLAFAFNVCDAQRMTTTIESDPITAGDLDALDRAARLAMTTDESAAYANHCRWGVQPVGGPYHWLVKRAAMDRPEGFRVWPSLDDYATAAVEVRARLAARH